MQFEIHDHELPDSSLHRGWLSGVLLERTDAQLWTFSVGRLVRMDYYPDFRAHEHSWAMPGGGERRPAREDGWRSGGWGGAVLLVGDVLAPRGGAALLVDFLHRQVRH
jgi:hypothetical protein